MANPTKNQCRVLRVLESYASQDAAKSTTTDYDLAKLETLMRIADSLEKISELAEPARAVSWWRMVTRAWYKLSSVDAKLTKMENQRVGRDRKR